MREMPRVLRIAGVLALLAWALAAANAQAFTLIGGAKVTVSPTSGYPSTGFKVTGTYGAACGPTYYFNFYFDSTLNLIWTSPGTCATNLFTAGPSPSIPPPDPSVKAHTIIVNVTDANNQLLTGGSATTPYTIVSPPPPPPPPSPRPAPSPVSTTPPPQPSPSPSPSPISSPSPSPSPASAACPAAMLPPAGTGSWGDNLIAGLVVAAVVPLAGLAVFGPGMLLAFARRRRRLLMLIGLTALTALTLSCTTIANSGHPTPAALISPAPSPSCSA